MRQALEDLIEVVEAAISVGDWKVDGACEPTLALIRAKRALEQTKQCEYPRCACDNKESCKQKAQPEQEPVAWVNWCAATGKRSVSFECESELASQPLYTKEQS